MNKNPTGEPENKFFHEDVPLIPIEEEKKIAQDLANSEYICVEQTHVRKSASKNSTLTGVVVSVGEPVIIVTFTTSEHIVYGKLPSGNWVTFEKEGKRLFVPR